MGTFERDQTTLQALRQSAVWQRHVVKASLLVLAKAGPIELESLSDEEHEEIRAWATGGDPARPPRAIAEYLRKLEM